MSRDNDQPFGRGLTFYNGGPIPNFLSPPSDYDGHPGGFNIEGKEYVFEDGSGAEDGHAGYGTGMSVRVRAVRNASGYAIKPGQLCKFTTTYVDGVTVVPLGTCVGSITTTTADGPCYPADEFLPAAGVPNGDLFYVVVDGPCLMTLTTAANAATVAAGQKIVSQTATATTSADAGNIVGQTLAAPTDSGSTTLYSNQVQNAIGRAMSQATSHATGTQILVDIGWE
jgi:hypothetical protein